MKSDEITDEMLDDMIKCDGCCGRCKMNAVGEYLHFCTRKLSSALKSERAARKNNPGVWDNAPEWAAMISFDYYTLEGMKVGEPLASHGVYTRELPKSPERKIAEKKAKALAGIEIDEQTALEIIESAINEYKESVK